MTGKIEEQGGNSPIRKMVFAICCGMIAGFGMMYGVMHLVTGDWLGEISKSAGAAVMVGAFYILAGVGVGLGALRPKVGSRILNVEDADELMEQRGMLLHSCLGMSLWGAGLIVAAIGGARGVLAAIPALAITAALVVAGSYFAWASYRASDELMKQVNAESTVIAYVLTFAVVGGWALLEHLGLAAGQDPIDVMTMFYVLGMVSAFIASGRRGMLKPR